MTTTITIDPRFGAITRVFGPSPLWVVCGALRKVLVVTGVSGRAEVSGESADLGAEVLAVNTETSPNCHVLTANGLTFVTNTSTPQIVSQVPFNPGGGTWLHMFGGVFLATPLAKGGIQVIHGTSGVVVSTLLSGMQSSKFAAADTSTDRLWVVDPLNATLSTFTVSSTSGAITFLGKIRAPNCRDVVKVVVDLDEESLFVVCRYRILRFGIPTASDTPSFAQDYGTSSSEYTDFTVLRAGAYWVGQLSPLSPLPTGSFYGRSLGVWSEDGPLEGLIVASPLSSVLSVNTSTPYYDAATLSLTVPPPPVTSSLPTLEPPIGGSDWTLRATPADNSWKGVCYGNGLYVAVAGDGAGNRVMTSPDGINWTARTSAANNSWNSVCYGNGLYVAVASSGSGNRVMTSPDGINWTSRVTDAARAWNSVCYGNGVFVSVAVDVSGPVVDKRAMNSPDGINWTLQTTPSNDLWASVCYGNALFVSVAASGTGNRVMTAPG